MVALGRKLDKGDVGRRLRAPLRVVKDHEVPGGDAVSGAQFGSAI